ncbi:MAG: DUF4097 domain-containing protein [Eubacteriaceae bacterium]|nr:DUF4097 domain-containing protein [Eubacteriaceae bacterium]
MKKLIGIGAVIFLAGALIFAGSFAALGWNISKLDKHPAYEIKELTVENKGQNITINDKNVSFVIGISSDKNIHFEYYENDKNNYKVSNGSDITFTKQIYNNWYDHFFNFDSPSFTILLPASYSGSIEINTSNAGIEAENLTAANITLNTSNGPININNFNASKLSAKTSNGHINTSGGNIKNICALTTSNSKITAENITAGVLNADTSNSAIEVDGAVINGNVSLITSNGQINFEKLSAKNNIILRTSNSSISGSILGAMSDFTINSKTSNGSNSLPENAAMGAKNLNVKTSNGNIKIDFVK